MNKKAGHYNFTTGFKIQKDQTDVTEIIETLYQEIAIKSDMNYSFQDMKKEIEHLINQMDNEKLIQLFTESLFLNTITYENQMMEKLLKKYSQ